MPTNLHYPKNNFLRIQIIFNIEIISLCIALKMLSAKKYFSAVGCLTCKEKKENTSKCKYIQKFHYLCHCVLKPWFVHPKIIFTIIISDLPFKVKYSFDHCHTTYKWIIFRALRYQWISAKIKVWHPWQL